MFIVAYLRTEDDERMQLSFVIENWQNCSNENADDPEFKVAGSSRLVKVEAVDHRGP